LEDRGVESHEFGSASIDDGAANGPPDSIRRIGRALGFPEMPTNAR
jgi:hypothetical protein